MQIYIFANGAAFSLLKERRQYVRVRLPVLLHCNSADISASFISERRLFELRKFVDSKIELNRRDAAS